MGGRSSTTVVYQTDPALQKQLRDLQALREKDAQRFADLMKEQEALKTKLKDEAARKARQDDEAKKAQMEQLQKDRKLAEEQAQQRRQDMERLQKQLKDVECQRQRDAKSHAELSAKQKKDLQEQQDRINNELTKTKKEMATLQAMADAAVKKLEDMHKRKAAEKARLQAAGLDKMQFNIAVVGQSGVGKSTLINALLQRKPTDANAAPVNAGGECTMLSTKYQHPQIRQLCFWDVPGGGTGAHPGETYCDDHCLDLFDLVIVCFQSRWTELSTAVVKHAREHKRPLVVAHPNFAKIVQEQFENTHEEDFEDANKSDVLEAEACVRQKLRSKLPMPDLEVLCVESRSLLRDGPFKAKYDGPKLVQAICRIMAPNEGAAQGLIKSFRALSEL